MANNTKLPKLPDIETMIKMGVNPKTGLPMKMGGLRSTTKEDIKKVIRKNDEQIAVTKYTWYNLPTDITSQELERLLYYHGQLAFWYMPELKKFFFTKYALDGQLDFYGRYTKVHPIPVNSGGSDEKYVKAQEKVLSEIKLDCVYGIKLPEDLTIDDFNHSCVLLHDYSKQLSQQIIPTQILNDPVIDLESEVFPFLRTSLLMGTGIKGVRVADADQEAAVREGSRNMTYAAIQGEPYVPIVGQIDFQELTDGQLTKAADYLQAAQAIDNFRLGLHGVPNGGLFDKSQYVNNEQTNMNLGGADVSSVLEDGLLIRQNFCNIVNSIWNIGIWCEPAEHILNMDLNGDDVAYDRDETDQGGIDDGNNN